MKTILWLVGLGLLLGACEGEQVPPPSKKTETPTTTSLPSIKKPVVKELKIGLLDDENVDVYGGVALMDLKRKGVIAFVNERTAQGMVMINGKKHPLTTIVEKEDAFVLKGKDIEIITSKANYDEPESDCLYGQFDKVTLQYKETLQELSNIQVQNCSHLGL